MMKMMNLRRKEAKMLMEGREDEEGDSDGEKRFILQRLMCVMLQIDRGGL